MRPPLEERMLRLAEELSTWSTCHVRVAKRVRAEG